MALPKFLQSYLPSYNLARLSLDEDKEVIITQILNMGDTQAVKWLFRNYPLEEVKEVVSNPSRGRWRPESLNYWQKIFDIRIPKFSYRLALFNLTPQAEPYQKFFAKKANAFP